MTEDSRRKGKATELRCAASFLLDDWDVAFPLVDTGSDLIVSKGVRTLRVQCRGKFAGQPFDQDEPWEGHPAPDVLYLDNGSEWWVVPYPEFRLAAGLPKRARDRRWGFYDYLSITQRRAKQAFGPYRLAPGIRLLETYDFGTVRAREDQV